VKNTLAYFLHQSNCSADAGGLNLSMEMRLEKRDAFTINGYLIETLATDESYDMKSIALREKHEKLLRADNATLYGATWFTDDGNLYYLFGAAQAIETEREIGAGQANQNHAGSDNVLIPKGLFAVATVPKDMLLIQAWGVMWETGLPSIGYNYIEAEKCFELFGENDVREIWVPVLKA